MMLLVLYRGGKKKTMTPIIRVPVKVNKNNLSRKIRAVKMYYFNLLNLETSHVQKFAGDMHDFAFKLEYYMLLLPPFTLTFFTIFSLYLSALLQSLKKQRKQRID